jgi:uncharacterized protein
VSDMANDLNEFDGAVRLFPLPNFVMLPHVVKPFHIFEPRYKEMTEDALMSDRFITLILQTESKEGEQSEEAPPIAAMGCLTRIVNEQRLPDGRFNLLLRGVCRVRLIRELATPTSYRQAEVELLPDVDTDADPELRDALSTAAKLWLPPHGPAQNQFQELLKSNLPLGALCDIVGFAMPLTPEIKQQLLDETDIASRAGKLITALSSTPPPVMQVESPPFRPRKYPPEFSNN